MENEVELKILAGDFSKATDAINKMINSVGKATSAIGKLENISNSFGKNAKGKFKEASNALGDLGNQAQSSAKKLSGFSTAFSFLNSAINLARRASKSLGELVQTAVDYSEELNLFNVVFKNNMTDVGTQFSEAGLRAEKFQQQLNEAFGTNMLETRRFQALFQSMGENMGIVSDKAEIMSTNLTKLTYDIASLYNASEEDVGKALQAGIYAGQTKPLRRFGVDVTQTSMQPIADQLGLEKSISEMSQAEKQILRYLSVLKQTSVSHRDFANTIESPANQLKIFKQQCIEARIALGNLFIGMYAKILPYANALLMVIKGVAQAIASFFGIKVKDYNTGISTSLGDVEDYGDAIDGVGGSADKASKAIKELNRQTLKFDQINNIKSPTPTSGSSGGGGGGGGGAIGGIDQKLLDALKGYDNAMDKVRMKANDIRDAIMKWLGFTKIIDPETGKVSWKYEGLKTTIRNLKEWFEELVGPAKIFVGLGVGLALYKIFKWGSKIVGLTKLPKMISTISTSLKFLTGGSGGAGALSSLSTAFSGVAESLGLSAGALAGIVVAIAVAIAFITGVLIRAYKTDEDFRKSFTELGKAIKETLEPIQPLIDLQIEAFKLEGKIIKELVLGGIKTLASFIKISFQSAIDGLTTKIRVVGDLLRGDFKKAWEDMAKGAQKQIKNVIKYIKEWRENMETFMDNVSGKSHNTSSNRDLLDVEGISKETKKRLRFIMDDFDKLETYINEKKWKQSIITDEDYTEIYSRLESINTEFKKKTEEMRKNSKSAFEGLKDTDVYNDVMKKIDEFYDNSYEMNKVGTERINEIYRTAKEQHRQITDEEYAEIQALEEGMKVNSVNTLTQSQEEQKTLLTQMKLEAGSITLEQASEIIKNSKKAKDETIKNAKEQYTKQLAEANKMRDAGLINEEEYNKIVANAKDTRDKTIAEAEEQHKGVYDEFASQNEDIAKYIDSDTGKVKSNWDLFTDNLKTIWDKASKKFPELFAKYVTDPNSKDSLKYKWDNFWNGIKTSLDNVKTDIKTKWDNLWNGLKNVHIPTPHISWTSGGAQAKGAVKKLLETLNLPTSLPKLNVSWYASGGIPNKGTLFGAGENGPEIVGHINGRSEVLNQSQLASVMYDAVSRAISNSNLANGVEFYAHTDEGVIIDKINRVTRQTGKCPIEV